jgi:hypothetical protein
MVALYVLTSFLTASLLFLVQPMVGRMVLPAFGGSPQVWTTSMLFFQVALLFGYGYTHLTTTRLSARVQPWVHLGIAAVPLALLPIALAVTPSGRGGLAPSIELLAGLTVGVAAPFIVIATSGPLIQRWFSWTDHPQAGDPYFLYAAGNVGSAAGLLAYPFLLEPALPIAGQAWVWAIGYGLALVLLATCAIVLRRRQRPDRAAEEREAVDETRAYTAALEDRGPTGVSARRAGRWILLAFVPSSLMLAVTSLMSTDIAAVPLLWIVPLGLYLLSFTVAFSSWGPTALRWATMAAPLIVVGAVAIRPAGAPMLLALGVQALVVFVGGLVAHGLLAADRPPPVLLTRFYLLVAVGGALGGLFNSLLAPLLFPTLLEYAITIILLMALVVRWREPVVNAHGWPVVRRLATMLGLAVIPLALWLVLGTAVLDGLGWARLPLAVVLALPLVTPQGLSGAIGVAVIVAAAVPQLLPIGAADHIERTFFGVHRVATVDGERQLIHGTTVHGTQDVSTPATRRAARSYYHPDEPFGDLMDLAGTRPLGVLGLGAGGIAAYGEPDQRLVFHEIDPAVVEIAWDWFSYLEDTPADVDVILGDGRLTLDDVEEPYGILVMDAFTSDAVPVHLLTLEAFEGYLDAVEDDGLLAINISNRYLDLAPVLSATVAELGLHGVQLAGAGEPEGATASRWVALARTSDVLAPLRQAGWEELPERQVRWTDQRSSLFSVLIR